MNEAKNIIEINDLSYNYNHHLVLEGITFSVKSGEYLGVIGPNGGGKTTLVKIIVGLLKPTKGQVKILGQDVAHLKERYNVGYVSQRASQAIVTFPTTVEEIVRSGRTAKVGVFKRFTNHDQHFIDEAMNAADVYQFRKRLISSLSGGELQRVFIARALAGEPKILILDEPAVGIDIAAQDKFYSFLHELNGQGLTIFFVSHDIDIVAQEVHSVLCLNNRLICTGTPKDFIKQEYMEKLYGKKVRFFLHGHAHAHERESHHHEH